MFDRIDKHFCFFILMLLTGCVTAFSQRILTLEECVQIALKQNITLQSVEANIRSANLSHLETERSGLPQLKVGGTATYAPSSPQFGYDPALSNGGQLSAQFILQESLFDGGARGLRASQINVDLERFRAERRRVERDFRYIVTVAFFNFLQAQEERILQQSRVDELSDYLKIVNRLYHGGGVNYTDVLKTEVSYERTRVTLLKALETYVTTKVSLGEAMGTPRDTAFSVAGTFDAPVNVGTDSLFHNVLIDSLHNIDLRIADISVRRSLLDVDITRTERSPSVMLNGDIGFLTSGDNLRLPANERASMAGYSVGLSIENLLFNWGTTDLRIQQRQIEAENLGLNYEQQRRAIVADVERLRGQISSAMDQLIAINRTLRIAEDNYALTKAQYAGGGTAALEVLSAEQLLAETRLDELQTRADLRRLLARVEQFYAQ